MWKVVYHADPLCTSLPSSIDTTTSSNKSLSSIPHDKSDETSSSSGSTITSIGAEKVKGCNSVIIVASISIRDFFLKSPKPSSSSSSSSLSEKEAAYQAFCHGGRSAKVALADLTARNIASLCSLAEQDEKEQKKEHVSFSIQPLQNHHFLHLHETMSDATLKERRNQRRCKKRRMKKSNAASSSSFSSSSSSLLDSLTAHYPPYVLERTDVWCAEDEKEKEDRLHMTLRIITCRQKNENDNNDNDEKKKMENMAIDNNKNEDDIHQREIQIETFLSTLLNSLLCNDNNNNNNNNETTLLRHIATIVLQDRLRHLLKNSSSSSSSSSSIAFIADGSILPRKSGASASPMSCPPALPFYSPKDSYLTKTLSVDMGCLRDYLDYSYGGGDCLEQINEKGGGEEEEEEKEGEKDGVLQIRGMVIPKGVTLIVGGGYHGKSTLLRTIAAGVYNKIPFDGRERCVTVQDAVTVRAEDGRYVNNCNVSAFISNLPSMPTADGTTKTIDTSKFSTRDASGSTSQASNVTDAVEMGASAMLVDEDVSAANFMARDGRMRALVADESITPLLYRVNGLYISKGISSVVVVGGVGDWLDVPDNVVLLNRYMPYDALKKAQSISRQFSYGHVEYAGRGVVHRLPWDRTGTPLQRRPNKSIVNAFHDPEVELLDGGLRFALLGDDVEDDDSDDEKMKYLEDDEFGTIDMSRCEQLLGNKEQLYGCGLCLAWLIKLAKSNPGLGMRDLLARMDEALDGPGGMGEVLQRSTSSATQMECLHSMEHSLWESTGFAYRPRRFEVAMALSRMRGVAFEAVPEVDDEAARAEAEAEREAERRKKELADLWNNRRNGRNKK